MADENVVKLPTRLERLAGEINTWLCREHTNRNEWIEIQEGLCLRLAEARREFLADPEFGQWCSDNRFGEDSIDKDKRAAAIAMGKEPKALRDCLEATTRDSLQHIYRTEFNHFRQVTKVVSDRRRPQSRRSKQFEKAAAAYDALAAKGEATTVSAVAEAAGVSSTPARIAVAYKDAEAEQAPLTRDEMNKTMAKRYELAIRKARAEIREELKAEVYKELDVYVVHWKERSDRADRILAHHNGIMSRDVFRKIRACLHPDHNTFAHAGEALQIFTELEDVLVKPDDPVFTGPPLPTTAAELMARRRR